MIKSRVVALAGRDSGREVRVSELPALVADRYARAALRALGEEAAGGVVALALKHMQAMRERGEEGLQLLMPFVESQVADAGTGAPLRVQQLSDWRSIGRLQQYALLVHVDFLLGERERLDVPVALQADQIMKDLPDVRATFCSTHIAAVLESRLATYHELETALSTEDVFNLVEILNTSAIREWYAHRKAQQS